MYIGSKAAIKTQVIGHLIFLSTANILYDIPKNNPLNIHWDPAPAPEDGPPLSAGASRDKSLIPAQVGAIVGSYLFFVCTVVVLLVVLGRRLRRRIQTSSRALDIEMVETAFPKTTPLPTKPVSPGSQGEQRHYTWSPPANDTKNPYIIPSLTASPTTPSGIENPCVDTRIVEADRDMLQRDLEDIYAHVMEQEEAKANGVNVKEMPLPPQLQEIGPVPTSPPARHSFLSSKRSGKSRPTTLDFDEAKSHRTHSRTSSLISSLKSPLRSPKRKSIRDMQISSPIATPGSAIASDGGPLSPRYYTPPPPPPVPQDQVPLTHSRNTSSASQSRPAAEQLWSYRHSPSFGPRHGRSPSQASVHTQGSSRRHSRNNDPGSAVSATSTTPLFLPPAPAHHNQSPGTASSSNPSPRPLPFRSFEPALQSPSLVPATKTTVLERNTPLNGPHTGGLRTPWTAGAVPYSPYQPYSPVMIITPRLVTKEELKAKKKAESRAPVLEMIKGDDEIWDSGY